MSEEKASVFVPIEDDTAMRGFLLQALRANTAAMGRIAGRTDRQDEKLDGISSAIHSIDKRLAVIENNSIERDVTRNREQIEQLEKRMTAIEAIENQRKGAMGLWEWVRKNWPVFAALAAALFVFFDRGGRIGH